MHSTSDTLGRCPGCEAAIPGRRALIEYERDGERAVFAECPDCGAVVHPS